MFGRLGTKTYASGGFGEEEESYEGPELNEDEKEDKQRRS